MRLQQRLEGGAAPGRLKWIQAQIGQHIQMIPVRGRAVLRVGREIHAGCRTAQIEALNTASRSRSSSPSWIRGQFWLIHRSTLVNAPRDRRGEPRFRGRQLVSVKGPARRSSR
jgi:hypothetical protein